MADLRQVCTFKLGNLYCAVAVERVQEVLKFRELTKVPLAPMEVEGLINLRGHIVTAIDLRRRLSLPPRLNGNQPMNIVARTNDGIISFLVDEIQDVMTVTDESFEPPPETLNPEIASLLLGVYKLEDSLLLILDIDRLLDIAS
jgi:purine-binding chemotaxis protein CheW